jgi:hypothetical protein
LLSADGYDHASRFLLTCEALSSTREDYLFTVFERLFEERGLPANMRIYKKKINLSTSLAGQAVGIKEVDDGIWLVSFMDYDLGYIDLEERTLQPLNNPFGPKVYVSGTFC